MTSPVFRKILIVDDDPTILRILEAHLKKSGYDVVTADNGPRALELAEGDPPFYLITDWDMPAMDGLELCRRARRLGLPHYLYIVFLTGRSNERDLVAAIDAGADDFLTKPIRQQELLARLAAGARVLHLESHLAQLATRDGLTGLLLRRSFSDLLEKEWQRARRNHAPLSIVILDIDFFKQVNDTYGHPAGDEVICGVANVLRQNTRASDVICRFGGEEFCVLLPETDESCATVWADRLRCRIAKARFTFGTTELQVTVSLGVAGAVADMEDKDDLLGLADQCLLAAKEQGRNRAIALCTLASRGDWLANDAATPHPLAGVCVGDAMIPLIHSLRADWMIVRAAGYFLQYRVSSAPVTDEGGRLLGIVSEKDILGISHGADVRSYSVAEVMRSNVITYDVGAPLAQVVSFLTRASIRNVVVTAEGKPCGIISRASLLRWFLKYRWSVSPGECRWAIGDDKATPAERCFTGESPLLRLAGQLVGEADRLHRCLQDATLGEHSTPIVGGASRMQQLIDDLLAGAANDQCYGGLPT